MVSLIAFALAHATGDVRMVTDEAEAVLHILAAKSRGEAVPESDWSKLFATEGYRRLRERELGMKRKFDGEGFRKFVNSADLLARRQSLVRTLADWREADVRECQARALAYLPKGADISAKVYLLIKPESNSFVWDVAKDPAIMLFLDPNKGREAFVNTVAHEMHHIGYGRSCPSKAFSAWLEKQTEPVRTAYAWLGAFGEGDAVLAAAGGLNGSPEGYATPEVQADWAHGMAHQPEQFGEVQDFFLKVLRSDLKGDEASGQGMKFFGTVGPWYTVGYTMASTIEKVEGRQKLIDCYLDPRLLLETYNRAAGKLIPPPPLWSAEFVAKMR